MFEDRKHHHDIELPDPERQGFCFNVQPEKLMQWKFRSIRGKHFIKKIEANIGMDCGQVVQEARTPAADIKNIGAMRNPPHAAKDALAFQPGRKQSTRRLAGAMTFAHLMVSRPRSNSIFRTRTSVSSIRRRFFAMISAIRPKRNTWNPIPRKTEEITSDWMCPVCTSGSVI